MSVEVILTALIFPLVLWSIKKSEGIQKSLTKLITNDFYHLDEKIDRLSEDVKKLTLKVLLDEKNLDSRLSDLERKNARK